MSSSTDEPRQDPTPEVDVGLEDPSDDVLEQHRIDFDDDEVDDLDVSSLPIEADAADVDDQRRSVPVEDDDPRFE